jgi:hypothetical protein
MGYGFYERGTEMSGGIFEAPLDTYLIFYVLQDNKERMAAWREL